jgi:hypothetical protein
MAYYGKWRIERTNKLENHGGKNVGDYERNWLQHL